MLPECTNMQNRHSFAADLEKKSTATITGTFSTIIGTLPLLLEHKIGLQLYIFHAYYVNNI